MAEGFNGLLQNLDPSDSKALFMSLAEPWANTSLLPPHVFDFLFLRHKAQCP